MNGLRLERQLVTLNTHRDAGRKVHAVRTVTSADVVAIVLAGVMAVCGSLLAWHIFAVAMRG